MYLVLWLMLPMIFANCLEVRAETGAQHYERQIVQTVTYEDVEAAAGIPEEIELEVQDGDQETTVVCSLVETEELDSSWSEGFELPLTFHVYDADTYYLGDRLIRKDDDRPQILDCEEELLGMAGLSPADYRITDAVWTGDIYEDADGELCRDALATGQKRIGTYAASYSGTAVFDDLPGYLKQQNREETAEETVEAEQGPEESSQEVETERAEVFPEVVPVQEETEEADDTLVPEERTLWKRVIRTLSYIIGLGALLVLSAILILTGLRMVKKLRLWYDQRKRKSSRRR